MSRYPYLLQEGRWGMKMCDAALADDLTQILSDPFNRYHMGVSAENLVERWTIQRDELDAFFLQSHQKAIAAIEAGRFSDQIVPLDVRQGRKTVRVDTDEHPRNDTTPEGLAALRPAFKPDGQVTAGNASGINDGAAAVVMMSVAKAVALGLTPRLRLVARATAGVDPADYGHRSHPGDAAGDGAQWPVHRRHGRD